MFPIWLNSVLRVSWRVVRRLTDDHQNIPTSFGFENSLVYSGCRSLHCLAHDTLSSTYIVAFHVSVK